MCNEIIWLHEKALNNSYRALSKTSNKTKTIHVWDDQYYKNRSYSFKRLVFIYETLCELPVTIIRGNTIEVLSSFKPSKIIVPYTVDININEICNQLSCSFEVKSIKDYSFSSISSDYKFNRFFKYWNKAKKTVFVANSNFYIKND